MIAKGEDHYLPLDKLFNIVSQFDILAFYLNIHTIPSLINSPLRPDKRPSFSLYTPDGIKVRFKDFKTGETGSLIDLLMKLWNCNFIDVLIRLTRDLPLITMGDLSVKGYYIHSKSLTFAKSSKLQVKVRDWEDHDIEFWESQGISKPWLKFGKVVPISHIFFERGDKKSNILADKYAYAYIENKDNNISLKIYQPYSTKLKWLSNHNKSVWDLWEQLPDKGDILIITSSRKDALCIWENTGIPTCSLQSESQLPKENVINELKHRFNKIYVLYDNDYGREDNPGRSYGKLLADTFGLIQIEIPDELLAKDSSDLVKKHNREKLKQTIKKLIL